MCGIAGMAGGVDETRLRLMTQMLVHRGPDDGAIALDRAGGAGFGHRRLSIIDPHPRSRQPMWSADGRFVLVFNGEIFGFRALRDELRARGARFRTESDTETLLAALTLWGEDALARLDGQFAFALWDAHARRLLLARDHLGVKPLYYRIDGPALLFASEAKAILAAQPAARAIDRSALPRTLAFLWEPGERTLFDGVRTLEPGSLLVWEGGSSGVRRYWDVVDIALRTRQHDGSAEERAQRARGLAERVRAAVQSQLVSDAPLGILLSGGLDSTIVLAAAAEAGAVPGAFTAAYSAQSRAADVFDDDGPFARLAAAHYGAALHTADLEPSVPDLLPRAVWHLDEPLGDPTVLANLELTRAARASFTVLLSGMGADELYAGYPRIPASIYGRAFGWIPRALPRGAAAVLRAAVASGVLSPARARRPLLILRNLSGTVEHRFLGYSTVAGPGLLTRLLAPDVLAGTLAGAADLDAHVYEAHRAIFARMRGASPQQALLTVDLLGFLPRLNLLGTDKTAMANSVEVRVPFLDHRLVEHALALPDGDRLARGERKVLLRRAFADVLPRDILVRKKTGYSPPVRGWLRGPLRAWTREALLDGFAPRDWTRPGAIELLLRENDAGTHDHALLLWELVTLEHWLRLFIDRFDARPVRPAGGLDEIPAPAAPAHGDGGWDVLPPAAPQRNGGHGG